jgi:hypothetical protein
VRRRIGAVFVISVLAISVTATGTVAARSSAPPSSQKVVLALKAQGLPIGKYRVYTAANDVNKLLGRPGQYISKTNFHDTRLRASRTWDIDGGGSAETFKNTLDAKNRFRYIKAITESSPLFAEYHWLNGRILLRVSSDLTPVQASRYKRALFRLSG